MHVRAGIIYLVLFAFSFAGINLVFRHGGLFSVPSLLLIVGGMFGGSLIALIPFMRHLSRFGWPELHKRYLLDLAVVVTTASAIPFWLQAEGLERTTASKGGIIFSLIPVLTAMLSRIVLERRATKALVIRIIAMVIGGILISWEGRGLSVNLGDLMIFGAAFSFSLSMVIAYRLLQDWPIHVVVQARLFLGGCLLVPFLLYTEWGRTELPADLSWMVPLTALLLVCTLYGIYYGLIALGPEFSTLFDIVAALLTVAGAYFLFGETLRFHQLVGGALIVLMASHLVWNIWHGKDTLIRTPAP